MKKLLTALIFLLPLSLFGQINLIDTFSTEVYHVVNTGTFRSANPKGETYIEVDASSRICIKYQSGAQVTQFSNWQNYRYNGQAFGSFAGAVDSIGIAIGSTSGGGGGEGGENFANTDLTFTGNRQHDLNGYYAIIREPGIQSMQLGADVPAGTIPIPNLKFSGFTGIDSAKGFMTLNGMLVGLPNFESIYSPAAISIVGDPFSGIGEYVTHSIFIEELMPGVFVPSIYEEYENSGTSEYFSKIFTQGNYLLIDKNSEQLKWQLGKDGSITHDGAYANSGWLVYNAGGNDTIPDNISNYVYDPGSIQANATITLPANPLDGQTLFIFGGGTITSGNVITSFTLDGNGFAIIGDVASQLKVGKALELHFLNNKWYVASH